jgi:aminoglycoside phosphotransferase (APT) family kinase protein
VTTDSTDPVKHARETPELRQALEEACTERGLSAKDARLIHRYSNAVFYLPAEAAVARVTSGSLARAQLAHDLTAWLIQRHGVAATAPLAVAPPVQVDGGSVVSFWRYYPQPEGKPAPTSVHLAEVLRRLHDVDDVPYELDTWQPLTSLSAALADPAAAVNLTDEEHRWLTGYVAEVRAQVLALDLPLGHGLIHGDAWAGNLLWDTATGPDAAVIGDWDWTSFGPREVDLIPTWHAAIRYGRGMDWATGFAEVYGYELVRWEGFPVLFAMRDLVQLTGPLRRAGDRPEFRAVLRERLDGIRRRDFQGVWRGL